MSNLQLQKKETNGKIPEFQTFEENFLTAIEIVDDVVLKNYITKLEEMNVVPLDKELADKNFAKAIRMFKINEIVYAQDEDATYKLASVLNAVAVTDSSVFIMIDSDGTKVDIYMGIRSQNLANSTKTAFDSLKSSMEGHFPGIRTENILKEDIKKIVAKIENSALSIVTGVANYKDESLQNNKNFIQGLEKLSLTMKGQKFTGVILANPTDMSQLVSVRKQYENIYSMLAPYAGGQVSYGINGSENITKTFTYGTTEGTTLSKNESYTETEGRSTSITQNNSNTKNTGKSVAGKATAGVLATAGAVIGSIIPGAGTITGVAIGGGLGGMIGTAVAGITQETKTSGESITNGSTSSNSVSHGQSTAKNTSLNESNSDSVATTTGNSKTMTISTQNKMVQNYLERIDQQLERINEFESLGMWECAAYFISDTPYTANIAASTYKSLMQGVHTGIEISSISSWYGKDANAREIQQYVKNFMHPQFTYKNNGINVPILPTSLVSGKELAIHMALPRKSVSGFPVVEHADFAQEVISYEKREGQRYINLGSIYNMGQEMKNRVKLDLQSLTMHALVTGSTGAGKSNTIYEMLEQLRNHRVNFLIIEPAKGEYKNVFGHDEDVTVLGTNPLKSTLLKINPFRFPKDIHVLEHIDRLVEIFNVCWPMYAAMPAILKEAIIYSYEKCGWNLDFSYNPNLEMFPTFKDLVESLEDVIQQSAYDAETKGNYTGSLVTRVKSLSNGINGQLFCSNEMDNSILFDSNVIVDLSRIGSVETKSFIMGVLVMRLNEHRVAEAQNMNAQLKHVTVLEEAHNILKRTSTEQSTEGANVLGKSVEMLSNAIAEMRTYGEGFIIADQSPNMLDLSAIRNTNTKIIMRLPDEADRRLIGKSAGMKDEQLDEIVKLPKGTAVVFQNDWLGPVLCKIKKYERKAIIYKENISLDHFSFEIKSITEVIRFLLHKKVKDGVKENIEAVQKCIWKAKISTNLKQKLIRICQDNEFEDSIMSKSRLNELSLILYEIVNGKEEIRPIVKKYSTVREVHEQIYEVIEKLTTELSHEYKLVLVQHLLKAESILTQQDKLYKIWIESVRGGKIK